MINPPVMFVLGLGKCPTLWWVMWIVEIAFKRVIFHSVSYTSINWYLNKKAKITDKSVSFFLKRKKMQFLYKLTRDLMNGVCQWHRLTYDVSEDPIYSKKWQQRGLKHPVLYFKHVAFFRIKIYRNKASVTLFVCCCFISQLSENDMFSIEMDLCMVFHSCKDLRKHWLLKIKFSLKPILYPLLWKSTFKSKYQTASSIQNMQLLYIMTALCSHINLRVSYLTLMSG